MLLRPMVDLDSASIGSHPYIGYVVSTSDPLKLSRVRIRVPDLHGSTNEIPDTHLPWAMQVRSISFGGASSISTNSIPVVGSLVRVVFPLGDYYNPQYDGEPRAYGVTDPAIMSHYPDVYGFKDPDGNSCYVDMSSNTMTINFNGNVNLTASGSVVGTATSWTLNGNLQVNGTIRASQDIYDHDTLHGSLNNIRTVYNSHTHRENNVSGNPDTNAPTQQLT